MQIKCMCMLNLYRYYCFLTIFHSLNVQIQLHCIEVTPLLCFVMAQVFNNYLPGLSQ